jgi:hypothetical protein
MNISTYIIRKMFSAVVSNIILPIKLAVMVYETVFLL